MGKILLNLLGSLIAYGYIITCMIIFLLLTLYTIENCMRQKKPYGLLKSLVLTIIVCVMVSIVGYWLDALLMLL